jgi:hypothetical protein
MSQTIRTVTIIHECFQLLAELEILEKAQAKNQCAIISKNENSNLKK